MLQFACGTSSRVSMSAPWSHTLVSSPSLLSIRTVTFWHPQQLTWWSSCGTWKLSQFLKRCRGTSTKSLGSLFCRIATTCFHAHETSPFDSGTFSRVSAYWRWHTVTRIGLGESQFTTTESFLLLPVRTKVLWSGTVTLWSSGARQVEQVIWKITMQ